VDLKQEVPDLRSGGIPPSAQFNPCVNVVIKQHFTSLHAFHFNSGIAERQQWLKVD